MTMPAVKMSACMTAVTAMAALLACFRCTSDLIQHSEACQKFIQKQVGKSGFPRVQPSGVCRAPGAPHHEQKRS
jgi:hypothetical protein